MQFSMGDQITGFLSVAKERWHSIIFHEAKFEAGMSSAKIVFFHNNDLPT